MAFLKFLDFKEHIYIPEGAILFELYLPSQETL
jgi:hypothetical protein